MNLAGLLSKGAHAAVYGGPLNWLRVALRRREFIRARAAHSFLGVFPSFDAAVASAPDTAPVSYDNPVSARMYLNRLAMDEYDYPAVFWIGESLREGMRSVADIGGAVGIKYFAFEKLLKWPADLRWKVIDMPAVAEEGRRFGAERGVSSEVLSFSDRIEDADGVDLFYASGALQYLEKSLPEILAGYATKPRRLLINTTPIHEKWSFFTLNSIGSAYCGYRVMAREAFIAGVQAQGYRLRDSWKNPGKRMRIIDAPEHSLNDYSGFCFDRI